MFNFEEQGGEAKAVGWISMSDMFMLCSIVMLAVAVCFALSLKRTDSVLNSVQGEYANYRNINTLTIDELKAKAAQLTTESGGYKSQANGLDQQLKTLKIQYEESEHQLALFKEESVRFRTRSEGLAGELNVQTLKLNAVQSEFEKYKSINTLTLSELKSELLRLTKELDGYKSNVASLTLQVSALQGNMTEADKNLSSLRVDREKYKAEGERLAAELQLQKTKFEGELAKAGGDLTRITGELTRANDEIAKATRDLAGAGGEKAQLLADLNKWKSAYATLQKDEDDLKLKLSVTEGEKKRIEAKLADLEGTIVGLTGEIGELKPQIAKLKVDLTGANLRIIDLEKAVFEKINRAKLVVTVAASDVPKGFTLELFVTDPLANECGPFSSVIFNDGDEIGVLQQSVDFKSGLEGSQKAVFYSLRPVYARNDPGRTYTVKAMIRQNGNDENVQLPHPITVTCSIDLPNVSGPNAHKTASLEITSPGYIKKTRRNGQLTANTPYKNMWPWEPVYHFERTVCDFRIEGDAITNLRTFDKIVYSVTPGMVQGPTVTREAPREQKIDSIRNRSGN